MHCFDEFHQTILPAVDAGLRKFRKFLHKTEAYRLNWKSFEAMTRIHACVAFLHTEGKQEIYEKDYRYMIIKPCEESMNMITATGKCDSEVMVSLVPLIEGVPDICSMTPTVVALARATGRKYSRTRVGRLRPALLRLATAATAAATAEVPVVYSDTIIPPDEAPPPPTSSTSRRMRGLRVDKPITSSSTKKSNTLVGFELATMLLRRNPNTWVELSGIRRGIIAMNRQMGLTVMNSQIARLRFYENMSIKWQESERNHKFEVGLYSGMIYKQEIVATAGKMRRMKHSFCYNKTNT